MGQTDLGRLRSNLLLIKVHNLAVAQLFGSHFVQLFLVLLDHEAKRQLSLHHQLRRVGHPLIAVACAMRSTMLIVDFLCKVSHSLSVVDCGLLAAISTHNSVESQLLLITL